MLGFGENRALYKNGCWKKLQNPNQQTLKRGLLKTDASLYLPEYK
jgi:hypothetical protein